MNFKNDFEKREAIGREAFKELKKLYPNTFKWDIQFTTGDYDTYDAYWFILDENYSIKKRVWVEIKWRDSIYEEYILETKKLNKLIQLRKENFTENEVDIFYLCFAPDGTFMWKLNESMLEDKKSLKANKETSISRTNKIDKGVIFLKREDGKRFEYIPTEKEIINLIFKNNMKKELIEEISVGLNNIFDKWMQNNTPKN